MRKNKPIIDTKRYSGFRIAIGTDEKAKPYRWQKLVDDLKVFLPLVDKIKEEPYYLDDAFRHATDPMVALIGGLNTAELFFSYYEKLLVSVVTLSEIAVDRSADFEAWVNPVFRGNFKGQFLASTIAHEVIDYAFKPFPEGLGLIKLKANVAKPNQASLRAARALKFDVTGYSRMDALYHGTPTDTVLLELLNPRFFEPVVESLSNGQVVTSQPSIHADSTVHSAIELHPSPDPGERGVLQQPDLSGADEPDFGDPDNI